MPLSSGLAGWLQFFLLFFHFTTGSPLDLSLILTNKDTIFKRDAFIVYGSRIQWPFLIALILIGVVWPIVLQARFKIFPTRTLKARSFLPVLAWPALMAVLILTSAPSLDEFALFGRSVRSHLNERITEEQIRQALPTPYPYVRTGFPLTYQGPRSDRPDIFVVLLESFNERLVEKTAPNGLEITPVFNSLIRQGVYVENFYNNSMQTSRALFIIFSGVYESYKGKAFRMSTDLNLRPLPEILDEQEHRTVFFNAHDDLNFDNKGPYLRKMGFRSLVAMTAVYPGRSSGQILELGDPGRCLLPEIVRLAGRRRTSRSGVGEGAAAGRLSHTRSALSPRPYSGRLALRLSDAQGPV